MSAQLQKHIELVEAVNNAKTEREHENAENVLRGFRIAIGYTDQSPGRQLIDCDLHYINQGIDRPMCCGVWLDWTPEVKA